MIPKETYIKLEKNHLLIVLKKLYENDYYWPNQVRNETTSEYLYNNVYGPYYIYAFDKQLCWTVNEKIAQFYKREKMNYNFILRDEKLKRILK